MPRSYLGASLLVAVALVVTPACSSNRAIPAVGSGEGAQQMGAPAAMSMLPDVDTTSVLKKLTKQVVIGSTVDPSNGDKGPRGLAVAPTTYGLKKGTLLVCNFYNKANVAGNGTTVETLTPKAGSKPKRFAQNAKAKGCSALGITQYNAVWSAGLTAPAVAWFNQKGKFQKAFAKAPIKAPLGATYVSTEQDYAPQDTFVGDAQTGSIISISNGSGSGSTYSVMQVATGFAVNKLAAAGRLGPASLRYNKKGDLLFIVDGVNNTIVAFHHATELLEKNEIIVQPGGKTFKCKANAQRVCGGASAPYVVKSGAPLNAPLAAALLPNGNLIIANTKGSNMLIEMTPTGKVLDTKVVDKGAAGAIFGLAATGTTDGNTTLYFTDKNGNNVQALEH